MSERPAALIAVMLRTGGWLAVLAVVVVSLLPGSLRPHVLPNNYEEHFAAYLITGCILGAGYPGPRLRLLFAAALAVGAGALELSQVFIAGRTASIADFAAGVAGGWLGLHLPYLVDRLSGRGSRPT
ncbi:MAG: hypothetical protein AB1586_16205 [Pseudomonadota bacterium]|jgi:hypothetical protein